MTALSVTANRISSSKMPGDETISWVLLAEKLLLTGMGCFSEVF
jgi:hypothetical protein